MKKLEGIIIFLICSIIASVLYCYFYCYPVPSLGNSIYIDANNNLIAKFNYNNKFHNNKIYYLYSNKKSIPSVDDKNWSLSNDTTCSIQMKDNERYYLYLKNENNEIYDMSITGEYGKITNFNVKKEKIYLAIDGEYKLSYELSYVGKIDAKVIFKVDDENIAKVDDEGIVKGISKGNTIVHCFVGDLNFDVNVIVTDLITVRPQKYNSKKPYLGCNYYTKEDNDLLDEILKDRINDVGYKTRAGVVEAARFLALEFPYKIRYFSENGRLTINGIDGEGRYYHVGLYLDESRYDNITKSMAGPKTWGCQMYSRPTKGSRPNGLDCSGFVSWVLLNGGFDVGDLGAGLASHLDLTDYGERTKFNLSIVNSGKVKVGDLLSSGGVDGGHIAIIVGEDDKYYYVAESLWTPPNVAVVIIGYDKKTIFNRYYYVMYMDSYYKEDGNLTQLWY